MAAACDPAGNGSEWVPIQVTPGSLSDTVRMKAAPSSAGSSDGVSVRAAMRLGVAPGAPARGPAGSQRQRAPPGHRDSLFLLLQAAVAPA